MTIKIGDKVPSIKLKRLGAAGLEEFDTAAELAGKKIVLFGLPGAFTPPCSQKHLPGYIKNAVDIKSKGVDDIICLAVNDPFVMKHWGETIGAEGKVSMWPDGNGLFSEALGLTMDGSGVGLGKRSQRFLMVVENGVVQSLDIEPVASDVELSGADACMVKLG